MDKQKNDDFKIFKKDLKNLQKATDKEFITFFKSCDESYLYGKFFHYYFGSDKNDDPLFIERLISFCPNVFVKAIRVQKVAFTSATHWKTILGFLKNSNSYISTWIEVLDFVRKEEIQLWNKVEQHTEQIKNVLPSHILIYVSWWYESKRLDDYDQIHIDPLNPLAPHTQNIETREFSKLVLEEFLSYYFSLTKPTKPKYNDSEAFACAYLTLFKNFDNDPDRIKVFEALKAMENWDNLKTLVNTISYDLNYDVIGSKVGLFLRPNSIAQFTNWDLNGLKYGVFYKTYVDKGFKEAEELLRTGQVYIPRLDSEWGDYNVMGFIETYTVDMFTKDYCIRGYDFEGDGNIDMELIDLIKVLCSFYINARKRFTDFVDDLLFKNNLKDWKMRLDLQIKEGLDNGTSNFALRQDYLPNWRDIISSEKKFTDKEIDNISRLISIDLQKDISKKFNRFSPFINLTLKPFIKFGDWIFSFTNIFGEVNQWGFGIVQNALDTSSKFRKKVSNEESKVMEKKLGEAFCKEFENVVYSKKYKYPTSEGTLTGDIDLMVYESGCLLLGELKRTKLRLDLESAWLEHLQTNNKGVSQLEKHKKLLKLNPQFFRDALGLADDFDFSNVKIVPVVISTSFEDDGRLYGKDNDIQKVSYYEVMTILEESDFTLMRWKTLNPLEEIGRMFQCRWIWHNLPIFEPKAWNDIEINLPLENISTDHIHKYYESQSLGNEAYNFKQYTKALALFSEALIHTPKCPYILESIGNCYSMMKMFDRAEEYYNKALEIAPDYYQLMMNNIQNLLDMKRYDDCMEELLRVMKEYGQLPFIRCKALNYINYIFTNDLLSEEYKQQFEEKWKEFWFYDFSLCDEMQKMIGTLKDLLS